MRQSIKGIYLKHFPYSETSAIIKVFTQEYGLQSFIAKGIKKKKGAAAALQPFHLLEIECSYNPNKSLNYAGLIKLQKPPISIIRDVRKSMVLYFSQKFYINALGKRKLIQDYTTIFLLRFLFLMKVNLMPIFISFF